MATSRQERDEVPPFRDALVFTEPPLDVPFTVQPVASPSTPGAVADRVFIGDQDGTLWRLNLTSNDADGDPKDWTMDLFFDGFPGDGTFDHDYDDGQPIETPPIISVDRFGSLTVAFSTGRQEIIGGEPGVKNYVWSLTEKPSADRQQLLPASNWYKEFDDTEGQRVIGTMALFSSNLYFTTMGLKPEDTCGNGSGGVWAMHYTDPHADGVGLGGRVDRTTLDEIGAASTDDYARLEALATGGALSGATVSQEPTCANAGFPGDDEYFSYGAHNALGNVQGGAFKLIIPIGKGQPLSGSPAQVVTLGEARGLGFGLQSPAISTRVDSWAAIVE